MTVFCVPAASLSLAQDPPAEEKASGPEAGPVSPDPASGDKSETAGAGLPLQGKYVVWEESFGLANPNEPLCADFNLDGRLEVLLSSKSGRVLLVEAATGRRIWTRVFPGGSPLLDPLPGQFLNSSPPEIALFYQDGRLRILCAASGETVVNAPLSLPEGVAPPVFVLSPSIIPAWKTDGLDTLVAVGEDRCFFALQPRTSDLVANTWAGLPIASPGDIPLHPLVVGRFARPDGGSSHTEYSHGDYGAVFATRGKLLMFVDFGNPVRPPITRTAWANEGTQALVSCWESAGGRIQTVFVDDPLGNIRGYTVDFARKPASIEQIGEDPVRTGCVPYRGCAPLVADLNGDGRPDLVCVGDSRIVTVDWETRTIREDQAFTIARKFVTPPALFFSPQSPEARPGTPILVIGEDSGALLFVDLTPGKPADPLLLQRAIIGPLGYTCPLVLDVDGRGRACLLVQKRDTTCLLATGLPVQGSWVHWPAAQGGKLRTGGRSPFFERFRDARQAMQKEILQDAVKKARAAIEQRHYREALAAADQVRRFNPYHTEGTSIRTGALVGLYRTQLALSGILGLAVLAFAGLAAFRFLTTRTILRRMREMSGRKMAAAILPAFQRYFKLRKGPALVVAQLAELCVRHELLPRELTTILEKGHRSHPEDKNITLTLARLYLDAGRLDGEAAAVFEKACRLTDTKAPFELALGRIALAGNLEDARPLLESAYKLGCRDPHLYDALAEVYTKLDLLTPRHLPVFETAAHQHPDQAWVLETLAKTYVLAGLQQDGRAQSVFRRLAGLDPDSVIANQEIAAAQHRAGHYLEAKDSAQKALKFDPDNPVALQILAWCLWEEEDVSSQARLIYFRASEHQPNDTLLLRIVAEFLLDSPKCEDFPPSLTELRTSPDRKLESAPSRIIRAIQANPSDREFLACAAEAGMRWQHPEILRLALEDLLALGELTDPQTLALAGIYVAGKELSPQHVGVLAQAFAILPDMEGFAELLAEILMKGEVYEERYLDVFQFLFARAHEPAGQKTPAGVPSPLARVEWGIHLAKIHSACGQYGTMADTLQRVLEEIEGLAKARSLSPGDTGTGGRTLAQRKTEVQHLLALAHTNLRNFSEAVTHYQSVLASDPADAEALVGLGRTYARMDKTTPEMHEAILRARALAPEDPHLSFASANIAAEGGKWNDASALFLQALKAGGEYVAAVFNRLELLVRRYPGAHSIPARWIEVQAFLALKRYDQIPEKTEGIYALNPAESARIAAVYDRILHNDPRNVVGLFGRARALHRDGRHTEARQLLETALQVNRNHEPAKRLMVEVYESLLRKQGENLSLRFALGQLAMQLEDYDRAVPCFQKTRVDPQLEKASSRFLAECFFHKQMYELALQEFQNVTLDAGAIAVLYQLGKEFENQGHLMAARMAYQRIYGVDAGFRDVADRLNNLTQSSDAALRSLHQAAITLTGARPLSAQDKSKVLENLSGDARQRYDLLEEMGRGAMATVYRAHDTELDEEVALKILPDNLLSNPEALRRFRLEARSARKLTHENIVRIHDIGEEHGRKYISMEFINGETLKNVIHSLTTPLTMDMFLRFARQIASGMAYAHANEIVHRDLKPANIMITRDETGSVEKGCVKITDFGIAKVGDHASQTLTGAVVGTPLYMSPEQVLGQPCDARADIYSFGVILYEMVLGNPPFHEGDLAYHHLHTDPPPIAGLDPQIEHVIMKCLEKERGKRWQSFDLILSELNNISVALAGDGSDAEPSVPLSDAEPSVPLSDAQPRAEAQSPGAERSTP